MENDGSNDNGGNGGVEDSTKGSDHSALSYTLEDLSRIVGGKGKALACWQCILNGVDPKWYFGMPSTTTATATTIIDTDGIDKNDSLVHEQEPWPLLDSSLDTTTAAAAAKGQSWTRQRLDKELLGSNIPNLSEETRSFLTNLFPSIEQDVASLSHMSTSLDGTTKLLLKLCDGFEVETVIIPWTKRGSSTLCIS